MATNALRLNGSELTADEMDAVDTIQALAAGDLTEEQLTQWIAGNTAPVA
jgi:prophage maintenance system killer protein